MDMPSAITAYVDAAAGLIGLPLDPAHRPGVVLNFERLAHMARLVVELPLSDEAEPALIFRP